MKLSTPMPVKRITEYRLSEEHMKDLLVEALHIRGTHIPKDAAVNFHITQGSDRDSKVGILSMIEDVKV